MEGISDLQVRCPNRGTVCGRSLFVQVLDGKHGLRDRCLALAEGARRASGTLLIPALCAVLAVFAQDHADSIVDEVERPFKFRCSCGVMSELDITPGAVCEGVKVEDIIAPTLYESNLDTKGGRRPENRPGDKGCCFRTPGLATQRGSAPTAETEKKGTLETAWVAFHSAERGGAERPRCAKGGDPRTPGNVLSRTQVAGRRDATQARSLHGYFHALLCWTRNARPSFFSGSMRWRARVGEGTWVRACRGVSTGVTVSVCVRVSGRA